MDEEKLVTITTVSFNSAKTISKTIESVLNQTYPFIEYIIKDGMSTDETIQIAHSYKDEFIKKGYIFKVVSLPDEGMYDALNQAIEMSSGFIVGNVNSDDFFEKNAVEAIVNEYLKKPYDMIYASLRIINGSKVKVKKAKFKKFVSSRYWNHPTTFIRREVLLEEKYANKTLYDDFDLMIRIRKKYNVRICDEVLSNFVFGGMSTKKTFKETVKRIKIKNSIYRKNGYKNPLYFIDTYIIEFLKYLF